MYKPKSAEWFMERMKTGKRVYRDKIPKCCPHCDHVEAEGLIVGDAQHASYLSTVDIDYANENIFMNYRDER